MENAKRPPDFRTDFRQGNDKFLRLNKQSSIKSFFGNEKRGEANFDRIDTPLLSVPPRSTESDESDGQVELEKGFRNHEGCPTERDKGNGNVFDSLRRDVQGEIKMA